VINDIFSFTLESYLACFLVPSHNVFAVLPMGVSSTKRTPFVQDAVLQYNSFISWMKGRHWT